MVQFTLMTLTCSHCRLKSTQKSISRLSLHTLNVIRAYFSYLFWNTYFLLILEYILATYAEIHILATYSEKHIFATHSGIHILATYYGIQMYIF